eukprot:s1570_g8.t1
MGSEMRAKEAADNIRVFPVNVRLFNKHLSESPEESQEECPGAGAWRLACQEGPLRLQSRCGFYVEVRPALSDGDAGSQASSCGRCLAIAHLGKCTVVSQRIADFQPPKGTWPRCYIDISEDVMKVVGAPPSHYGECWLRQTCKNEVVVLELEDETRNRAGLWIFQGRLFGRVLGATDGPISGTCCASLARLLTLRGEIAEVLRSRYEAVEGEVEAPGELRIRRDVWDAERAGNLLYSYAERPGAILRRTGGKVSHLLLRLRNGASEEWKVHVWDFDPFNAEDPEGPKRPRRPSRSRSNDAPRLLAVFHCLMVTGSIFAFEGGGGEAVG